MKLLEGSPTQPVPLPSEENRSLVLWKGRVLEAGAFPIRLRSSSGVTLTKSVTVTKAP
jgi:hypothetical protein